MQKTPTRMFPSDTDYRKSQKNGNFDTHKQRQSLILRSAGPLSSPSDPPDD